MNIVHGSVLVCDRLQQSRNAAYQLDYFDAIQWIQVLDVGCVFVVKRC